MWTKIKLIFQKIQPDLIRFLKAAIKMAIDTLLPVALNAVVQAQARGGTGSEKFAFAVDHVKSRAPEAALGAVHTAVQSAWATKEAEGWE